MRRVKCLLTYNVCWLVLGWMCMIGWIVMMLGLLCGVVLCSVVRLLYNFCMGVDSFL